MNRGRLRALASVGLLCCVVAMGCGGGAPTRSGAAPGDVTPSQDAVFPGQGASNAPPAASGVSAPSEDAACAARTPAPGTFPGGGVTVWATASKAACTVTPWSGGVYLDTSDTPALKNAVPHYLEKRDATGSLLWTRSYAGCDVRSGDMISLPGDHFAAAASTGCYEPVASLGGLVRGGLVELDPDGRFVNMLSPNSTGVYGVSASPAGRLCAVRANLSGLNRLLNMSSDGKSTFWHADIEGGGILNVEATPTGGCLATVTSDQGYHYRVVRYGADGKVVWSTLLSESASAVDPSGGAHMLADGTVVVGGVVLAPITWGTTSLGAVNKAVLLQLRWRWDARPRDDLGRGRSGGGSAAGRVRDVRWLGGILGLHEDRRLHVRSPARLDARPRCLRRLPDAQHVRKRRRAGGWDGGDGGLARGATRPGDSPAPHDSQMGGLRAGLRR